MKNRSWAFLAGGLLVALLLAGVVSNYASSHPDGLDSSLLKGCTVDADDNIVRCRRARWRRRSARR
jgi:cobalt/nickel transport protein